MQANVANTGNQSDGVAGITTGDATATGNSSDTGITQVADAHAGGRLGGIAIIRQSVDVTNDGDATANTGNNSATGNGSDNEAETEQEGEGGEGTLTNIGSTSNSSDGTAGVDTGDANATGNSSTTNVTQIANASVTGSLGGLIIIDQSARVVNNGDADANTGRNEAIGNDSDNDAETEQSAVSERGPPGAINIADTTNESDGTAGINTGNATATGNRSDTTVTQTANGTISGRLGGFVIANQYADVENIGSARANTGENEAIGNNSENEAETEQEAEAEGDDGEGLAVNIGTSRNTSDGTASIETGNATAIGNQSRTTINQSMNLSIVGNGFYLADQTADVDNEGDATANTGDNEAVGNASENDAEHRAEAEAEGDGDGSAINIGTVAQRERRFRQHRHGQRGGHRERLGDFDQPGDEPWALRGWVHACRSGRRDRERGQRGRQHRAERRSRKPLGKRSQP